VKICPLRMIAFSAPNEQPDSTMRVQTAIFRARLVLNPNRRPAATVDLWRSVSPPSFPVDSPPWVP
jgi:hypothetical protein